MITPQEDKDEIFGDVQGSLHRLVLSTTRAARCVAVLDDQARLAEACRSALCTFGPVLRNLQHVSGEQPDDPAMVRLLKDSDAATQRLGRLLNELRDVHA